MNYQRQLLIKVVIRFLFSSGQVDDGEKSYHIEPFEDSEVRNEDLYIHVLKLNIITIDSIKLFLVYQRFYT